MPRTADPHATKPADLPATVPVFPLSGALLLPGGRLPLNIFEPRYLAMTEDALSARDRLIVMGQPIDPQARAAAPELYPIGCAGRIAQFAESGDGRYLITLVGVCRCRLESEIVGAGLYRRFAADWRPFLGDLAPSPPVGAALDRGRFLPALKAYFRVHGLQADWDEVDGAEDEKLVTTLAMVCPFSPAEKQALLEAPTLVDRAEALTALIEIALMDDTSSDGLRH